MSLNFTKRLTPAPEDPHLTPARVDAECRTLRAQIVRRLNRWSDIELSRGHHTIAEQLANRAEELRTELLEGRP